MTNLLTMAMKSLSCHSLVFGVWANQPFSTQPTSALSRNHNNFMSSDPGRCLIRSSMLAKFSANVLCRAPLIPCFLGGGEKPTFHHGRCNLQTTQSPFGRADSRKSKGDGSKLYEWGEHVVVGIRTRQTENTHRSWRTIAARGYPGAFATGSLE